QFGATNCGNPADADGNCLVDIRDYGIWRLHFGEGTPPVAPRAGLPPGWIAPASPPAAQGALNSAPPADRVPAAGGSGAAPSAAAGDPAAGNWALLRAEGPGRAVPVVPEADDLSLLVGGLLGLGGLAGWRALRPPGRQ